MLINAAGGGSGSFAVQLAKRLGAHVTGVDNAAKLEFMRALGADDVIDYREQDFTSPSSLRLDPRSRRTSRVRLPVCTRPAAGARCVGGPVRALLRVMTVGWIARPTDQPPDGHTRGTAAHFEALADLCIAGNVAIHIDRTYGLDEVPDALAYVGEGHALGKVVVMVDKATENGRNTNNALCTRPVAVAAPAGHGVRLP